jgi:hypothetical protein
VGETLPLVEGGERGLGGADGRFWKRSEKEFSVTALPVDLLTG